jgi:hypothetical protein
VDPVYEIVGAYFSVASHGAIAVPKRFEGPLCVDLVRRVDLLINAVTAAIVDV